MPDRTIQPNQVNVKKTPVEFVEPYNHLAVPLALDYARQDYFGRKEHGLVQLAYKHKIPQSEVAQALEVDQAVVSRKYPKDEPK